MIAVIADDITGAAELAGIAWQWNLRTQLITREDDHFESCDVLVVATDARSMSVSEAIEITAQATSRLSGQALLYRKTDSALRGHVVEELQAMLASSGADSAIYVPANPSKGRIIRQGTYLINGVPIDETDFTNDPEYPARSAKMTERFPEMIQWQGTSASGKICFANAESVDDINRLMINVPQNVLLAGAADLFTALLVREYPNAVQRKSFYPQLDLHSLVVVCGSTLSKSIPIDVEEVQMPMAVYNGQCDQEPWVDEAERVYTQNRSIILTLPKATTKADEQTAKRMRILMSLTVDAIIRKQIPHHLIVEGGATAFTLLRTLGWSSFMVVGQIAPGVVTMQSDNGTFVTLKPGSYDWGGLFGLT